MLAFLADLAFNAVELVIFAGVILAMIAQVTHARWTKHPLVRGLILATRGLCAPARMLMKRLGLPLSPVDFSPMVTVLGLRVVQGVVVGFLRLFP
jgi:uncharacterized protein YggT (Ycf19 family)